MEPKKRIKVPSDIYENVLKEFNHRCARCGADHPQIHHIDENPSNNDPLNLIPLCPNCHLVDEHNPTRKIDPGILSLFRQYKDPAILKPQFKPLYNRLRFFNGISEETDVVNLGHDVRELTDFVAALKMGDYYSKYLKRVIPGMPVWLMSSETWERKDDRSSDKEYREKVQAVRDTVYKIIVELLNFQSW